MSNVATKNYLAPLNPTAPYDDPGRVATVINEILEGGTNASGTFTLDANAASTTFKDPNFDGAQYVEYWPLTSNAAAEKAAGSMYQDTTGSLKGVFKIVHANNAQTDRKFYFRRSR